eukprot:jgi/Bigna1/88046/estExt_fgenesh1_pg.C_270139
MGLGIDGGGEGQGGDSQGGGADEGEAWWTEIIMGIGSSRFPPFSEVEIYFHIEFSDTWAQNMLRKPVKRLRIEYTVLISSQLVGKVVNKALKLHFNQKRPSASGKTSNGMPSYHSQHAFFFASYLIQNSIIPPEYWPLPISAACLVAYSRVGIQMHSFDQVIAIRKIEAAEVEMLYS